MSKTSSYIGLFGFGCVGKGFHDLLRETPGIHARIQKICVKDRSKPRPQVDAEWVYDPNEILNDPDIDVIVELIDDDKAAFRIASTALRNGVPVISANKKMLAEKLPELLSIAKTTPLLYEAAVAAAIPIIRTLDSHFQKLKVQKVEGILNGSTNFILSQMENGQLSFEEALNYAQEIGFAETDHRLDTDAFDPKFKLSILLLHAFGLRILPNQIPNLGIDSVNKLDFEWAKRNDTKLKLVATIQEDEGEVFAAVRPKFIRRNHPLHSIHDELNAVRIEQKYSGEQLLLGKGAGDHATASAVLADLAQCLQGNWYDYQKTKQNSKPIWADDVLTRVYLRYENSTLIRKLPFVDVEEKFASKNHNYVVGKISLKELYSRIQGVHNEAIFLAELADVEWEFVRSKVPLPAAV